MIGHCIDYLDSIPTVAKGELSLVLQENRDVDPSQVQEIFPIAKCVKMNAKGDKHPSADNIREILTVIEIGSSTQNQTSMDHSMSQMEEALQKKGELRREIDDFESKQGNMLFYSFIVLVLWGVGLLWYCVCKKKKPEDAAFKESVVPEAQQKKMSHLVNTLGRMDEEIEKMTAELERLQKRRKEK